MPQAAAAPAETAPQYAERLPIPTTFEVDLLPLHHQVSNRAGSVPFAGKLPLRCLKLKGQSVQSRNARS